MSLQFDTEWIEEFGLAHRNAPTLITKEDDISFLPQAHLVRRAFKLMSLNGALCLENCPVIYFKKVKDTSLETVLTIHKQFWNHGGAPILVLISNKIIHVYSGMSRPVPLEQIGGTNLPSLIKVFERYSVELVQFILQVETGEFFYDYGPAFNPDQKVDRDLLSNLKVTREILTSIGRANRNSSFVDAFLCRLVFTCYLFDRSVIGENYLDAIGIKKVKHLRDILGQPPDVAKTNLYKLFSNLGKDFNGDLFSDNLEIESNQITNRHIGIVSNFFNGSSNRTGQISFWPYDFGAIPIETISAIYEHFLKDVDHETGAFYTPRFLAEIVLDSALQGLKTLIGKKFLDPACGSGIFLVGIFNRIAEEWTRANPTARNDRRARELRVLLQTSLFGIDINPTACRITAFSLYLAYLDQLSPRDIQELQEKGAALPKLVVAQSEQKEKSGNIHVIDFFDFPHDVNFDLIIGNPPWGSFADSETLASQWCVKNNKILPDNQIAVAFTWKASEHISTNGKICFVLPHGVLFNNSTKAIDFQKQWLSTHSVDRVLNLADFRWFLFSRAVYPALVINYRKPKPNPKHIIEYWAPKADWLSAKAEIISIQPSDRNSISLVHTLKDLEGEDGSQIWKKSFWGTSRDIRLLDRLSSHHRLRDHVRKPKDVSSEKPWIIAEGFQPVGKSDDPKKAEVLKLPTKRFLNANSTNIDLFILPEDCDKLVENQVTVRQKSNKNTEIFKAPLVIISEGFTSIAFSNYSVSFQDALRGIHGPEKDREVLAFLAAYARSPLAKYFLFHTSSSWGIARPVVRVHDLLRLPMPLPAQMQDEIKARAIVNKVASIIEEASERAIQNFLTRELSVDEASRKINPLIYEYFDIQPLEKKLIEDTINIIIPSIQPTIKRMPVPTIRNTTIEQQEEYGKTICDLLNSWSKASQIVSTKAVSFDKNLGLGMVVLKKGEESDTYSKSDNILLVFDKLRKKLVDKRGTINPTKGLMFFDQNLLYILKPLAQRNWMSTSALNDADEIASSILFRETASLTI